MGRPIISMRNGDTRTSQRRRGFRPTAWGAFLKQRMERCGHRLFQGLHGMMVFNGSQWILPIVIAIICSLVLSVSGLFDVGTRASLVGYASFFGTLILSFGTVLLIVRQVAKMPDEKSYVKPPSPPKFD